MYRLKRRGEARARSESHRSVPLLAFPGSLLLLLLLTFFSRVVVRVFVHRVVVRLYRSGTGRQDVDAAPRHEVHPRFVRVVGGICTSARASVPSTRTPGGGSRRRIVVVAFITSGIVVGFVERREIPRVVHHGGHDDVARGDAHRVAVDLFRVAIDVREDAPLGPEHRPGERVAPERAGEHRAAETGSFFFTLRPSNTRQPRRLLAPRGLVFSSPLEITPRVEYRAPLGGTRGGR